MVRKFVWRMVAAAVLLGVMAAQAPAQFVKDDVYSGQGREDVARPGTQQPSLDQGTEGSETMTLAAASGGVNYFWTHRDAVSFARSISGSYYYSITKSGRMYRVDYWGKNDHG
jgi:hypothetical protein